MSDERTPPVTSRAHRPPRLGQWLLRRARLDDRLADCEADLVELFTARMAERGIAYARRRYVVDALSVWHRRPRGAFQWRPDAMLQDIRFAFRLFRRQAVTVTLAVIGLGLAIGVNTTAFSVVSAQFLRPLGVPQPELLVAVNPSTDSATNRGFEYAEYLQFRESAHLLKAEAWSDERARLSNPAEDSAATPYLVVRIVSGGYFETLGGHASLGRVFRPADDEAAATPIAAISDAYWRSHFGADPAVIGRSVRLTNPFMSADALVQIVGVLQPEFTGTSEMRPAIWLPIGSAPLVFRDLDPFAVTSRNSVSVVARLSTSGTLDAARQESAAVLRRISAASRESQVPMTGARLEPVARQWSAGDLSFVAVFMGIVGLVLLLACTNIANLLLSGTAARQQEIGARLALGASRARIARQLLTESLLLGVAGGGLGYLATMWMLPAFVSVLEMLPGTDVSPDWRVYAFMALTSIVAGLAAGLAPARFGARGDVLLSLKGAGFRARTGSGERWRAGFVGIQAAASIVLLVLAALFGRAMLRTATMDLGFDPARFLIVEPYLPPHGSTAVSEQEFVQRALERAPTLPGVESAAISLVPPLTMGGNYMPTRLRHEGRAVEANGNRTSAGYFRTIGFTVLRGRPYSDDEVREGAPVAVVSASLARTLWGTDDPIGSRLDDAPAAPRAGAAVARGGANPSDAPALSQCRVIGIVSDVATARVDRPNANAVYLPLAKDDAGQILLRTAGAANEAAPRIKQALGAIDPSMRLATTSEIDTFNRGFDRIRGPAVLTGILGALAIGLAVIGLFGVTAMTVSQRLTEVGVRMALGATGADIRRLLLGDGLRPVAIGLVVGMVVALTGGQFLASVLYGISPRDPVAMMTAASILVISATVAVLIPARRAARVDPARVLRQS